MLNFPHSVLIPDCSRQISVTPGLITGLSGLGNSLLDCYQFLGENKYLYRAGEIAKNLLCYHQVQKNSIGCPEDKLLKLSLDFGSGSSGIGLFIKRFLDREQHFNYLVDDLLLN